MKILILSWYFPPSNTMGALRVGKIASFLLSRGHDVQVLSAADVPRPQDLSLEFPEARIARTKWLDIDLPLELASPLLRMARRLVRNRNDGTRSPKQPEMRTDGLTSSKGKPSLSHHLRQIYRDLTHWPDANIGWYPYALRAGHRICREPKPDIILASAPPFTGFMLGAALSKKSGVPWIAEFRDRWADDPYGDQRPWRLWLEERFERQVLKSAGGIVTVSVPWLEDFRTKYKKPAICVYNGFDPEDYRVPAETHGERDTLRIVYTGRIYPDRRDPTPLFRALVTLPAEINVRVEFYGVNVDTIIPLANEQGVRHLIDIHPHIPLERSIALQKGADLLLFMQWNDPREKGNVPGKLFEYLAARRPILGLGYKESVPATIVRERGAGFFCNDVSAIATQLKLWAEQKRSEGEIRDLPATVCEGFTRDEQNLKFEEFLLHFLDREHRC